MKRIELFFGALQVPVDYAMILLAGLFAYFVRTTSSVQGLKPVLYQISLSQYVQGLLAVGVLFVVVYAIDGLYSIQATKTKLWELYRVFRGTVVALMLIIVWVFLDRDFFSSRFIILFGGLLVFFFVSVGRLVLGMLQHHLLVRKGLGIHKLLLIGVNGFCSVIKKEVKINEKMGYKIIGHLDKVDIARIERIKKIKGIDEIIQCCPEITNTQMTNLKDYCMQNKIDFKYVPRLLQSINYYMQMFLGEPIIVIKNTPLDGWGKIIKRLFDIGGAIFGIFIFGFFMIVSVFAIWVESGRPVIFFNRRVGHRGSFDLYKFRYMKKKYSHGKQFSTAHNKKAIGFLEDLIKKQSIKKGPLYKIKNDPRRTKVGAFLEKYSIDELPQFFNVLRGEMSLVGPRPHQPIEVEKYEDHHKRVLTIKPGITGIAQVSGRSDLSFEDEVRLDIFYIENWSLWGDVKIIIKTIPALLKRRGN